MKAKFYGKDDLAEEICTQRSACAAKKIACTLADEAGWESERIYVMKHIIQAVMEAREVIIEAVPGESY